MSEVTMDTLVRVYRTLRDNIEEQTREFEAKVGELKAQQEVISQEILAICNAQNMDTVRTQYGTVSRKVQTRYWTNDWESMHEFIKENDAFHLLERRLHNTNLKQFLDENPNVMPKGLQVDNKYTIQVRKPTAKE